MGQITDNNGNTTTRQGDTFYIPLTNFANAHLGGTLYVQAIDPETNKMMFPKDAEPSINISSGMTQIDIPVHNYMSDLLTVPSEDDYKDYQYAVKHCYIKNGDVIEDTVFLGSNNSFGVLPTLRVYKRVVSGDAFDIPVDDNDISGDE